MWILILNGDIQQWFSHNHPPKVLFSTYWMHARHLQYCCWGKCVKCIWKFVSFHCLALNCVQTCHDWPSLSDSLTQVEHETAAPNGSACALPDKMEYVHVVHACLCKVALTVLISKKDRMWTVSRLLYSILAVLTLSILIPFKIKLAFKHWL